MVGEHRAHTEFLRVCVVLSMDSSPVVTEMDAKVDGASPPRTAAAAAAFVVKHLSTSAIWSGK